MDLEERSLRTGHVPSWKNRRNLAWCTVYLKASASSGLFAVRTKMFPLRAASR